MAPFHCDSEAYKEHYCASGGNKFLYAQRPYFKGTYTQGGYGNVFSVLKRTAVPLFKALVKSRAAKELGKDVLTTGAKVLGDTLMGKRGFKSSVKKHGAEMLKKRVASFLDSRDRKQRGSGRFGRSRKRRRVDILGE